MLSLNFNNWTKNIKYFLNCKLYHHEQRVSVLAVLSSFSLGLQQVVFVRHALQLTCPGRCVPLSGSRSASVYVISRCRAAVDDGNDTITGRVDVPGRLTPILSSNRGFSSYQSLIRFRQRLILFLLEFVHNNILAVVLLSTFHCRSEIFSCSSTCVLYSLTKTYSLWLNGILICCFNSSLNWLELHFFLFK